jgi:anti-sigma B factor antagonist
MNTDLDEIVNFSVLRVNEKRIDAHNSPALKDQILELIESGNKRIVVDMSAVRFVDSSGLGVLLSGYRNAASCQGELVLSGLQPQVKSMFELTRLHRVFKIYPSIDEVTGQH